MRIRIFKTEKELAVLDAKIKGKKLADFLHSEIIKKFGQNITPIPCDDLTILHTKKNRKKETKVKKETNVPLGSDIEKRICCEASAMGISPSTYIMRVIVDPALYS